MPTQKAVADALLAHHGATYADEAGITLKDAPAPLFQPLVIASLLSSSTSSESGVRTGTAVANACPTAERLAGADGEGRWHVLADARSLRERQNAHQLGQLADEAFDLCRGDLHRLAQAVDGDAGRLAELLQGSTGIGGVGTDIFELEVQDVWSSVPTSADERVTGTARKLGLPTDAAGLARVAGTDNVSLLGATLVCHTLADGAEQVLVDAS